MRLVYPGVTLDLAYGRVERGDEVGDLEPIEVRLLAWLHRHPERWVPPGELLRHIWGHVPAALPQTVQSTVERLVSCIEEDPDRPRVLRMQPGMGFRLEPPGAVVDALSPPRWDTPLVGRREALDRIDQAVHGHRLVCVVGPAGVGKTRLVADWAAGRRAGFVDASALGSPRALVHRIAQALGVDGARELVPRIGAVAATRGLDGLVLDGLDGLGLELESTLEALSREAPELELLTTCRRTPALQGAAFVVLEPLPPHEALALLQARAPRPVADAEASRTLVHLARRLPLAIELAAGALGDGSVVELVEALEPLELPHGIELAMAGVWAALQPEERAALYQLGVFEGDFPPEAIGAVLDVGAPLQPVLDALAERALVHRASDPRRLAVPAAVRAWVERDGGPPGADVRERHAAAYGQEATLVSRQLRGPGTELAMARLDAERPNLEAAAAWALEHGHSAAAPLVLTLAEHAHTAGRPDPGMEAWLVALREQSSDPAVRSRATLAQALAAQLAGAPDQRAIHTRSAHELAPADSVAEQEAAVELARTRLAAGDVHRAELGLREVLGGRIGRTPLRVAALITLGDVHLAQERLPEAQAAYLEAMKLAAELGVVPRWAWATMQAATVLAETGARPRALELLAQVIATTEGHGLDRARPLALLRRGRLLAEAGDREAAVADFTEAERGCAALGERSQQAHALFERGALLLEDDGHRAEASLARAVDLLEQSGQGDSPITFLARLARVQAWLDRSRTAEALREVRALSEDPRSRAEAFGPVLTFVRAVALALDGQPRQAVAAAEQAEQRFRGAGTPRAEVGAVALLAHLTGRADLRERLAAFPSDASPELAQLLRIAHGGAAQRTDWWLVRQLSRIPRAAA